MNSENSSKTAVTVLGAGSYGTALAFCLARNEVNTYLWGRNKQQQERMAQTRENEQYLPGFKFPEHLHLETELAEAIDKSHHILVVVPSHVFKPVLEQIKPFLTPQHKIAWATKGLDPEAGCLLQEIAQSVLGDNLSMAVLSGPTFAKEMAAGLPTAISLSSNDDVLADELAAKLHSDKSFRVYKNADMVGVQLGGAIKNVIAIGAGLADGLGFGANARTALITRGLAEMTRLGISMGADRNTFMGMAGLGDLVLTCTDNQSRNRRFGLALGQGMSVDEAIESIGQVVEGFRNTKEVYMLSQRQDVEMPITDQIYQVLYEGKDAKLAARNLLSRDIKSE
ncbi:NAD(P)H-dependent glycerol-3-phosphate dehydrogenase [Alteromonadaceae bacterium M269]|nr:NAD(P)H-dependent glycerol-3-phosphate dehydrogenase [Alteromonadaceae bacterium M269]